MHPDQTDLDLHCRKASKVYLGTTKAEIFVVIGALSFNKCGFSV